MSSCFFYYTNVQNWYEGRNMCLRHGGDLAVLHDSVYNMSDLIFSEEEYYTKYWIGIISEIWNYVDKHGKRKYEAFLLIYIQNHPSVLI